MKLRYLVISLCMFMVINCFGMYRIHNTSQSGYQITHVLFFTGSGVQSLGNGLALPAPGSSLNLGLSRRIRKVAITPGKSADVSPEYPIAQGAVMPITVYERRSSLGAGKKSIIVWGCFSAATKNITCSPLVTVHTDTLVGYGGYFLSGENAASLSFSSAVPSDFKTGFYHYFSSIKNELL